MNDRACDHCPCPGICLRRPSFCAWAKGGGELERRHICERSRIGERAPARYPPLREQARNLMGAVGRAAGAVLRGEPVLAPAGVVAERRGICLPCEFNGHRDSGGIRCEKCGCAGLKLELATERCPLDPPRWSAVEQPRAGPAE